MVSSNWVQQVLTLLLCCLLVVGGKFYIYPWTEALHDVYPPPNSSLHAESTYSREFHANDGIGKMIDGDTGLFQTWQFALYKNIMQRLRTSRYRTFDPEEATAFIIPFDCGVHTYIDHVDGKKRLGSPHGWVAKMLLENSPYMKRNNGHDHFVFFSITLYQMIGIGVKMFYQEICFNCTSLVIESSPAFLSPISGWPYKNYWYAVPYTASYHWWEGIKLWPSSVSSVSSSNGGRDIFTLFIGSIKTATVAANQFRKALYDQCLMAQNASLSHWKSDRGIISWCQWHTVTHTCHALVNHSQSLLPLYRRAVFCPAPVGDSLTRKSLFDSLLAGCIPVIFDLRSLSQYHWHIPATLLDQVAVYIPKEEVAINAEVGQSSPTVIQILQERVSRERIAKMQATIAENAHFWQYALVPETIRRNMRHFESKMYSPSITPASADATVQKGNKDIELLAQMPRYFALGKRHQFSEEEAQLLQWEPFQPDAVSVIIDRMLDIRTILPAAGNESLYRQYHHDARSILRAEDSDLSRMNRTYVRYFCQYETNVISDGVFYSRGLAWHRLRQICRSVGLLIGLHDGRVTDIQESKNRASAQKQAKTLQHKKIMKKKAELKMLSTSTYQ